MSDAELSSVVDILRSRADERPNQDAYIFLADGETEAGRLTYAEVDRRARAVGAHLRQRGATGERVLVAYPAQAGAAYVVGFLGCLYAGAVAVPSDVPRGRSGAERLAWMVRDATPRFALTSQADRATMAVVTDGLSIEPIDVTTVPDEAAAGWVDPRAGPETLALLQYTSGSTRAPRGVMVSHGNIVSNERAIATAFDNDSGSTFVGWLPLFHDMGLIANVLQPPYLGATSVLMPPAAFLERPARWLRALSRYGGVVGGGPNFAYDLCAARIDPTEMDGVDLSVWRGAFNGAEVVRQKTIRRFTDTFAPYGFAPEAFFACYGLAEATLIVTGAPRGRPPRMFRADESELRCRRLVPSAGPGRTLVSSGRPVHQTRVAVVDPDTGSELPPGAIGEIWVSGPGVSTGYWSQPEEPTGLFSARLRHGDQGRFLRTGDLGALDDGELYVVSRIKDTIIVRGQNHYPDDLEWTVESSTAAVRPSCGAAFSVDDGEERLVVIYEVPRRAEHATDVEAVASTVRAAVRQGHGIEVDTLALVEPGSVPKTTSGKVRRGACRDAYLSGRLPVVGVSVRGDGQPAPTLPLPDLGTVAPEQREARLAEALATSALRLSGSGAAAPDVDRPLSAVGLDSLGAIQLQQSLHARYRVELPPMTLLGDLSAEEVAGLVVQRLAAGAEDRAVATEEEGEGPLAPAQRALWVEAQIAPSGPAYSLVRAAQLRGRLDRAAIDRAAARLVARHPALRTRFKLRGDAPVQVVTGDRFVVRHDDLAADDTALHARLAGEAAVGFALDQEPPFRLTVLHRGDDDHVLVIAAHHVVADLWSLVIVVRELLALYREEADAIPAVLPDVRTTLIAEARRDAPVETEDEHWAYWQERLSDSSAVLDLPLDHARPAARAFRGATAPVRISSEVTDRLRRLSRAQHTTMFTALLTAFRILLSRQSGQSDVVVGSLAANRDRAELADLVGCLVNLVPLRDQVSERDSFRTHLTRARTAVLADLAHGGYPFPRLVSRLGVTRQPGVPPLVQALLVHQQEHGGRDDTLRALALGSVHAEGRAVRPGLELEPVPVPQPWTHLDITLNLAEIDGALTGHLEYDTALFDAGTATALIERFVELLDHLSVEPDRPIGALPATTQSQRDEALAAGRGPRRPRPESASLHGLVLDQAKRTPDAVAVSLPRPDGTAEQLSYEALARWASTTAADLRAPRRRARDAGRDPAGAVARVARNDPGRPHRRRRIRAPGPGRPARPARVDRGRRRRHTRHHDRGALGPGALRCRDAGSRRQRAAASGTEGGGAPGAGGVRHLHFRLHRAPEGRHRPPPGHRQPAAVDAGGARAYPRGPGRA